MEKHASEHDTSAHCTITGQARTPSASTGSRAHAGKMLNGSAPFSALRPVALHAWTALSDAERRWYRQCRGRSVLVTAMEAHDRGLARAAIRPFAWARPLSVL